MPSSLEIAEGTELADPNTFGAGNENPLASYWARPSGDSVYLTNAMPAGVSFPMMVISIT